MLTIRNLTLGTKLNKQKGFTLIELGLDIGIAAALVVALLVTFKTISSQKKTLEATHAVSSIYAAALGNFNSTASSEAILASMSVQPVNPWQPDGTSDFTAERTGSQITITMKPISDDASCKNLATKFTNTKNNITGTCDTGAKQLTVLFDNI